MHLCQASTKQPQKQQVRRIKPGTPDLSELSPKLREEWHSDNNLHLGGVKVTPQSNKRVLWVCRDCPAGCLHIWRTAVHHRSEGSKCPFCKGRRVCKHNSLATKAPEVARYWNHDKNANSPEETLAGSNARAEWKCPDCECEWQAPIKGRVRGQSGCPQCYVMHRKEPEKQPTFEASQHPLLLEWDYELNGKQGLHPHNISLGSSKYVHWVCCCCPKGQLHRYQMQAVKRTGNRRQGCPYCAGQQVCSCNSLQSLFPMIALEWDAAKTTAHQLCHWFFSQSGLVEERKAWQLEAANL